jgi:hypothetical protein
VEGTLRKIVSVVLMTLLLGGLAIAADVYQQGRILKWEKGIYPEKKSVKNWIVYQLQTDTTTYSIARKKENKPRLQVGEVVQYRQKDHKVVVVEPNGKKEEYQIVGQSAVPGQ